MDKKKIFVILTCITIGMFVYCCDVPIVHSNFSFLINHKNEGDLLYNIGVSFVAAYVFYIFQVFIPDYFEMQKQIPIRAAVQREVQFFTIWIVNLWLNYYEYAEKNGFVGGNIEKHINVIFDKENMLEVLKTIEISQKCGMRKFDKEITWIEYIKEELSKILSQGEHIKRYRADILPPDIYYAIFYLTDESKTIAILNRLLNNLRVLNKIGENVTLEKFIVREQGKSEVSIEMDAQCIHKLIQWVNQEYDYLIKQKKYSLDHICKINLSL